MATEKGGLKDTHEDEPARTSGSPLLTLGRQLGAEDHRESGPSIRDCACRHSFWTSHVSCTPELSYTLDADSSYYFCFIDKETKAQKAQDTCPKPHSL